MGFGEESRMFLFELEAAEALAGLARSAAVRAEERDTHQIATELEDQAVGVQHFSGNTFTTFANSMYTERNVDTPCSTSRPSKLRTSRQNLTEAEKEERRISRILANRESARRTIRRRQSMYAGLTEKVSCLSQEKAYLKKEKEVAVKKFNLLKDKNEFLKAQVTKLTRAKPGELRNGDTSRAEISPAAVPATAPIILHNHPSLVPFLWPSIFSSPDVFNLQCASNNGLRSSPQFHIPKPCSHQVQKCSMGTITEPGGTPLLLFPVPWLLPFLTQSGTLEYHLGINNRQKETPSMHQCCTPSSSTLVHEDHRQSPLNRYNGAEASKSTSSNYRGAAFGFPPDSCPRNTEPHHLKASAHHVNYVSSATEHTVHNFMDKNQGHLKVSGNVGKATEARKKRKALMKLKNIHGQDAHTQQ